MKKYITIIALLIGSGCTPIYAQDVRQTDKTQKKEDQQQERLDETKDKLHKKEDKQDKKQRKMDKKARKTHAAQRSIDRQNANNNVPQ